MQKPVTTLPSRWRGFFREEFYSFHSNPELIAKDTKYQNGTWVNVWRQKISATIYFIFNRHGYNLFLSVLIRLLYAVINRLNHVINPINAFNIKLIADNPKK